MPHKNPHGIIDHTHIQRKTDYLFRISMKSVIRSDKNEVLVVKEAGRTWWDLPGGGMDHNESIQQAIARELYEEIHLVGDFTYRVIAIEEPIFLKHANVWQIRIIFEVTPTTINFSAGEDAEDVNFIDPTVLKDSDILTERKVHSYWQMASQKNK